MTTRPPLTLPAITPSDWVFTAPGYPVATSKLHSASYPEIRGSLPDGAQWRLFYNNVNSATALALLLPWRASGGGLWPLTELPAEVAGGVNSADFGKRLVGTTWKIGEEPSVTIVQNGFLSIDILLVYELTFASLYGPASPLAAAGREPVLLGIVPAIVTRGVAAAIVAIQARRVAQGLALLQFVGTLQAIGSSPAQSSPPAQRAAGPVVPMTITGGPGITLEPVD